MGIKVGGIDVLETAINTEFRLIILENTINHLITLSGQGKFTQEVYAVFKDQAIKQLQAKYPKAGITSKL